MNADKKRAILVGVLFIIGTAAGIFSVIFSSPILGSLDFLTKVSANKFQIVISALLVLIMGFALAFIPIVIFPILKKHNEAMALGYVVFRGALETVTYFGIAMGWLLLIPFSQGYMTSVVSDAPYFQSIGILLKKAAEISAAGTAIVFPIGAVILYLAFYQSRLIPRWLSVWGLIGVLLHFAVSGIGGMFALASPLPAILSILNLPIALQEMFMAVWLIVKGFNSSSVVFRSN